MDVKQFFRKRLVAFVAALLSVGLCGQPQARADQNYQPDVNIGGTITGTKDIADYGVAEENGYIATFKNPNGSLNANIQDWKVTNNATQTPYGDVTYDGTYYYNHSTDWISQNAKLVLAAPTDSTTSAPRNVIITVKGTNEFGSGLNVGDWGNTMGPGYDLLPIKAKEVDVLFGSMNDGNVDGQYDGNTGAYAEVTFASGSNSHFWGGVQFGGQDGANLVGDSGNTKVVFEDGSTTTFENQNTYFGGGGWNADGVNKGGKADVTFAGGTTTFNQRAVFGGGASVPTGEDHVQVGDSNVTFDGGTNYFTGKNATYVDAQGLANQKNYYGVYFSSIGGKSGLAEGGTANVTINSGTNTFDTEVHSVGNYDFTPYGDIIRSKDDFDVTWGGNSNVLVTGGDNKFNGRSTFGAPNGTSTMNFNGGRTQFNGTVRSANMGKGDILDDVPFSDINTNYNGQDIPYVYFGGKSLTDADVNYWNNYYNLPGHDAFEMSTDDYDHVSPTINVNLSGRTKVVLNTTGFVGGADYKQLDGSVDIEFENRYTSSVYKDFTYGDDGAESPKDHKFTVDYTRFNTNADTDDTAIGDYVEGKIDQTAEYTHKLLKDDAGSGTFTVGKGAELRMGLYNTTQLYNAPDEYLDNEHNPVTPQNVGYTTNRSAQVQLIGNTSTFTANETTLNFTIDPNGTQCLNEEGEWVERLNVGRISFQTINIDKNTKLYLSPAYQGTLCNQLIGQDGKDKEFYSIEAFHDTDGTQLNIDPEINNIGGKHLFYEVGVEGLADPDSGTPNVPFYDKARLHVTYHDPHSIVADGNLGHNMDNYLHELCYQQEDDYQEALEDIWNSDDKIEAQEKFDDLAGGIYGDWLNAQVQRQISFMNMLSNRLVTDDMGLCQFCCQSQCVEYSSDCEPGCNQCCARRQCEFGGRICGKYPRYCEPRRSLWGSYLGNYGNGYYWKGFTQYHEESSGMAVGMEWKNVCCRVFGMYFGYSTSDIWHTNSAVGNTYSRVKSDDYTFGLYAKWDAHCLGGYWLLNGTFTYNKLDAERYYNTQSYNNNFTADPRGLSTAAYIERGWMYVEKHGFVINPYISLQYSFATIDDFTEEGTSNVGGVEATSNMRLHCYDMAYHSLRGQAGVRVSRDFIVGCNNWQILRLTLGGAYAHEFLDPQATYYTHVMGSRSMDPNSEYGDFEMKSNGCSRGWGNVMFSADYRITQRMAANFNYNVYFNQYKTVNSLNATLRVDF